MTKRKKSAQAREARVEKAIREIEARGEKATVAVIKEALGGSFRDLCPAIKSVRIRLEAEREAAAATPDMPQELSDLAEAFWREAWREADRENADIRQVLLGERKARDEETAELEEALGSLEERLEKRTAERDEAAARAEAAEARAEGLQAELQEARTEGREEGRRMTARGRADADASGDEKERLRASEPDVL